MKKITVICSIVLSFALSVQATAKPSAAEMYTQMKNTMTPAFEKMIPIYKDLKKCYQKKFSKNNYVACTKEYGPKVEHIVKTMLNGMGGDKNASIVPTDAQLKAFAWTKEIHQKTIDSLHSVLKQMQTMQECLKKSKNTDTFNRCSKKALPDKQ